MKILVIHTGGTIASKYDGGYVTLAQGCDDLTAGFSGVSFSHRQPFNILSENMDISGISLICKEVYDAAASGEFDGIIVTHGSDTLSFSAAVCEEMLGGSKTPIVFTAANYPLEDERSNGRDNFKLAVELIFNQQGGVYVAWKNSGGEALLCHGGNLLAADPYSDRFRTFMPEECYEPSINFELTALSLPVLLINCHPSMDFSAFDMKNFKAAVVYLYHSATAPTWGKHSLLWFLSECERCGKAVYLASFKQGAKLYETAKGFLTSSAVLLYDCCPERAFARALIQVNLLDKKAKGLYNLKDEHI